MPSIRIPKEIASGIYYEKTRRPDMSSANPESDIVIESVVL
jgi:hypothetical protein